MARWDTSGGGMRPGRGHSRSTTRPRSAWPGTAPKCLLSVLPAGLSPSTHSCPDGSTRRSRLMPRPRSPGSSTSTTAPDVGRGRRAHQTTTWSPWRRAGTIDGPSTSTLPSGNRTAIVSRRSHERTISGRHHMLRRAFLSRLMTPRTVASAHCDLPCGVYDPAQARIEAESVKAICEKYQGNEDPVFRTRALIIKEQRAELVKHHLWVLWTDYFKPPHFEKY